MKKSLILFSLLLFGFSVMASAQDNNLVDRKVINLYESVAPGMENVKYQEYSLQDGTIKLNVTKPTLEVFLPNPQEDKHVAMVVCPGGGMCILSYKDEGEDVARALNNHGITAFVLKYRTTPIYNDKGENVANIGEALGAMLKEGAKATEQFKKENPDKDILISDWCRRMPSAPFAFADAAKAMQLVRGHAATWQFDKVGIMGFSAGAVTTTQIMLHHDSTSRPDFAGVIYGGWEMPEVPADACPLFMASPTNDIFSPVESQNLFNAWRNAKKPAELHYYYKSEHGFGVKPTDASVAHWLDAMVAFMKDAGVLKK